MIMTSNGPAVLHLINPTVEISLQTGNTLPGHSMTIDATTNNEHKVITIILIIIIEAARITIEKIIIETIIIVTEIIKATTTKKARTTTEEVAGQCYAETMTCNNCGQAGHISSRCRSECG